MMESSKWRSGRAIERVVRTRPCCRGGKSSCAFSDEKGVAGEDAADMMLPAGVRPPLEVIQPELALQVLVYTLCPPTLLDPANELLWVHALGKRRQNAVLDGLAAPELFDDQPLVLAPDILSSDDSHADRGEGGAERLTRTFTPR